MPKKGEIKDRVGEENISKFRSKMKIIEYRTATDIDIFFPEQNYIAKNRSYRDFKIGSVKSPYDITVQGVGYLGEGKYKSREHGIQTKCYLVWSSMLKRCYNKKRQEKYPTYKGCKVCDEWLNFQNFAEWFYKNYYEIPGEQMHLDKDILIKGNKIYSPETCVFVPERINSLFTKTNKNRGKEPIGVFHREKDNKYEVYCCESDGKGSKYLGRFNDREYAFQIYKQFKETIIKQVADKYKEYIPKNVYDAMYEYEVEITD